MAETAQKDASKNDTEMSDASMSDASMSDVDKVREFFRLQYAGDYEEGFRRFALDGFRFVVSSADNPGLREAIPWAGHTHKGREGYENLYNQLFGEFDVDTFEPRSFAEADGKVYVEGHFRFVHKTTGKVADSDWCARFDMEGGRIQGGQFFENTFDVATARVAD